MVNALTSMGVCENSPKVCMELNDILNANISYEVARRARATCVEDCIHLNYQVDYFEQKVKSYKDIANIIQKRYLVKN